MSNIFIIQSGLFKKARYALAMGLVVFFFLLSNNFFHYKTLSWESCQNGKCQVPDENLRGISKEISSIFFKSPIALEKGKFYRLIFTAKSDQSLPIEIYLSKNLAENSLVQKIQIAKSDDFNFQEVSFQSQGDYDEIIFQKGELDAKAEVYFKGVEVFLLNIENATELSSLQKTSVNAPDFSWVNQKQDFDLATSFPQLKGERAVLGQLFQSTGEYISGVRFFADVSDNDSGSTRQFTLELREAIGEKNNFKLKKELLAELGFSLEAMKKYRQADGSFLFPVFARLEKGKFYFISINNGKIDDNRRDYLVLRGSSENAYHKGFAALRRGSDLVSLLGDLGFVVYGRALLNDSLISGVAIQDLGKARKSLFFKTPQDASAPLDLQSKSADVRFNEEEKVIYGESNNHSEFQYELDTPEVISRIIINAEQAKDSWSKITLVYSDNGKDWQKVEEGAIENGRQVFNAQFLGIKNQKKIYIKITYAGEEATRRFYGVRNFSIFAELNSP